MEAAPDSLERLIPDSVHPDDEGARETLELHLERYRFAVDQLPPGRWLDIACGVGYGSALLRREGRSEEVVGVDVSPEAVGYAEAHYASPGLRFVCGDAMRFADEQGFDGIVSLETVEHVPDPRGLLRHLVSLLRPGGRLVTSVPTTPSVDVNPHHLHDFTARSFRRLIAELGLEELAALPQVQRVALASLRGDKRFRRENLRPNLAGYWARHPGALLKRVGATLRYGLANHYLTVVCRRAA